MSDSGWQIYYDEGGDEAKRQHVETASTNADAVQIEKYVRARVPPTDRVSSTYGSIIAPGGRFDLSRLREPTNTPPPDWDAPAKPIVMLATAPDWEAYCDQFVDDAWASFVTRWRERLLLRGAE